MKLIKKAGATSEIWQIFVADSSSTTGAGLTALANNTSGLTAYYHRDTDTTATAISLVTMTVGTFTSSGFKEIDATNMPGWYQFCPPNAALGSGAKSCGFHLKGATNMAPLPIECQLTAVDPDSATAFITGVNSLAPPTNWNLISIDASGRLDIIKINGTSQTARDIGASVLLSSGTGTGQVSLSSGTVTTGTNNDKTGYSLSSLESPILESGTAQAGGSTSITLRSGASATSSLYRYLVIRIYGGTGAGQARVISAYNGGTKVATVDTAWTTNPDATSTYAIIGQESPLLSSGSVTSVITLVNAPSDSSGVTTLLSGVTVTTNNDKSGYSLAAGQLFVKKNTQITVTFPMTDSTTHLPKTGVTVTAQRSIDGAAIASCANSATELSLGLYSLVLAAADVNGAMITLVLSGSACDTRFIGLVTQA